MQMMLRTFSLSLFLLGVMVMPVLAQDKAPDATAPAAAAKADPDYAKKMELAQEMHKIRPAKTQVQEAIDQVSKNLSPEDRDSFKKMVEKAFDYDRLEKISTETMVELFTVAEMQKMIDYFGSPEAKSIALKLPKYQEKLQPEIIRMLDAAMLAQRTGGSVPPPPNAPKPDAVKAPEKSAEPAKP
jgi:hypothetical protein